MKEIWFDMDGTIADLYGVNNWLESLMNSHTKPYREAKPLVNMRELSRELNRLQRIGYKVGIISWLSRGGSHEYNARVTKTKIAWLERHIGSVHFDEVHVVEYGTNKGTIGQGILFDDEERNRKEWMVANYDNMAFNVNNILEILRAIH